MAKTGIEFVVFGKLNEKTGEYTDGKYFSETSAFNGTPTKSSAKDYGDNHLVEVDNTITGGTITWEANREDDEMYVYLLGNKELAAEAVEETDGKGVLHNANDLAPYVGVGAVGKSGTKYRTKFYYKVQFSEPTDENTTKQENTTFNHVTLEGEIFVKENGDWKEERTFDTRDKAIEYLKKKVSYTDPVAAAEVASQEGGPNT